SHDIQPWDLYHGTVEGNQHISGKDGEYTDLFHFIPDDESDRPDAILIAQEERHFSADEICEKLRSLFTPREIDILKMYLDGYSFTNIGEALGLKDRSFLSNLIFKLTLKYKDVIDVLYLADGKSCAFEGLVPSNYLHFVELEEGRKARRNAKYAEKQKAKGKTQRRSPRKFANDEERKAAHREADKRYREKKKARAVV
ncbi:MAG: hypothetical protein IJF38_07680, partial [Clostridia bacterium]|nr:hypothetical protein [Clostridia bacterium]